MSDEKTAPGSEPKETSEPVTRRHLLLKGTVGLAATAIAASTAEADTRTTVVGAATGNAYGLAVVNGAADPDGFMPALNGSAPAVLGAISSSAPSPTAQSAVMGLANVSRGVQGFSNSNYGVYGQSTSSVGVRGEIPGTSASNAIAVYGVNSSSFAGPSSGAGGFGVYGLSARGHGLVGATATAGAAAVVGATNGVAGAYAAAFYGPVAVSGDFTVFGAKSAAVPHPDGSHRRLYCVESPESWFEDFGGGKLECGRCEVTMDPDFAAIADVGNYHVFLTAYDGGQVLHVTNRTPRGFTVVADALAGRKESELSSSFSWRVVAKRKDIKGERLAPVVIPAEPTLPSTAPPNPGVREGVPR